MKFTVNKTFVLKVLKHLKNKYIFITLIFILLLLFFDKNNIISQFKLKNKYEGLKSEKQYYIEEIEKDSIESRAIEEKENLEKFGRENYLMKKENEEVFVINKKNK